MGHRRHFVKALFHALATLSLAAAGQSRAEETLDVVTEDWKPYNYQENGEVKGASTEVVKAVLAHAKIKYKINVYPWARAYNMAQNQANVMIYTIIRIPQREKLFKWVRPFGEGGTTHLYRLKSNPTVAVKTVDDAKKHKIAANNDSMDHVWLKSNGFTNLETTSGPQISIKMLFGGRVDMMAFDSEVLASELKSADESLEDVATVVPLFRTPPYMAVSLTTSDKLLKRLQDSFDELARQGKISTEIKNVIAKGGY